MMRLAGRWCVVIGLLAVGSGVARGADSPRELLEQKGLIKSGKYYLVSSEGVFLKQWKNLRPDYEDLVGRYQSLVAIQQEKARIFGVDNELIQTRERLAQIDNAIGTIPPGNNSAIKQQRQELTALRTEADNHRARLRADIDTSVKNVPPDRQFQQMLAEFDRLRAGFHAKSTEARAMAEATTKEYTELKRDNTVTNALKSLRLSSKAQVDLGPSPEFKKAVSQLREAERNVKPPARNRR